MVRTATLILIVALLMLNIALLHTLSMFLTDRVVFDMDTIRYRYEQDLMHQYMRGCDHGTDYPEEQRRQPLGFNDNSWTNWCLQGRKDLENNMYWYLNGLRKTK